MSWVIKAQDEWSVRFDGEAWVRVFITKEDLEQNTEISAVVNEYRLHVERLQQSGAEAKERVKELLGIRKEHVNKLRDLCGEHVSPNLLAQIAASKMGDGFIVTERDYGTKVECDLDDKSMQGRVNWEGFLYNEWEPEDELNIDDISGGDK